MYNMASHRLFRRCPSHPPSLLTTEIWIANANGPKTPNWVFIVLVSLKNHIFSLGFVTWVYRIRTRTMRSGKSWPPLLVTFPRVCNLLHLKWRVQLSVYKPVGAKRQQSWMETLRRTASVNENDRLVDCPSCRGTGMKEVSNELVKIILCTK